MSQQREHVQGRATVYQISAEGILDSSWSDSVGGMDIVVRPEEGSHVTVLTGELPDQAALSGVLNLLYDLGLELTAVNRLDGLVQEEKPTESNMDE